jgi:hypothetical protein
VSSQQSEFAPINPKAAKRAATRAALGATRAALGATRI